MANTVGKRYICAKCGAEVIITRGSNGSITCCNQSMELRK